MPTKEIGVKTDTYTSLKRRIIKAFEAEREEN